MDARHKQGESGTQDAMNWYSGGATKSVGNSRIGGMKPTPAEGISLVLQKMNLLTSIAALILFFLPWIDIRCSEKSMTTQTGIQTIHGGYSLVQEMEAFEEEDRDWRNRGSSNDSTSFAPLVLLAFLAVGGAVVTALLAIRFSRGSWSNLNGMLCALALGLLAAQMMVGFPAKKNLREQLAAQANTEQPMEEPFKDLGKSMTQAMMMQIQIKHLPALYIELILLGIPTLILANGLIDRIRQA